MLIFVKNREKNPLFYPIRQFGTAAKNNAAGSARSARKAIERDGLNLENSIFPCPVRGYNAVSAIGILTKSGFLEIRFFSDFDV